MLSAFLDLGYEVDVIKGIPTVEKINSIKHKINKGFKYDFLYGESTNSFLPIDINHFPKRPLLDIYFLNF